MASISSSANGSRTIQFMGPDKKRKSIRLGKIPLKAAEGVCRYVENLVNAIHSKTSLDADTAKWVGGISDQWHKKLVAVGLVQPRQDAEQVTLSGFLASYRAGRKDVAAGTQRTYGVMGKRLLDFFKPDCKLVSIKPGDADRYADHLRATYAQATAARSIKMARQLFRRAVRLKLVTENPFEGVLAGRMDNQGRYFFVTREATAKLLEASPSLEWRLMIALARYGGLRTPSETSELTWADVLWDQDRFRVHSPKTRKQGKGERIVPLFPELRPLLEEAFDQAEAGTVQVVPGCRDTDKNLRTHLLRIIRRAGLVPWPRLFQNLRASRETELTEQYPLKVVTTWLGNSPDVALDHYLSATEEHFQRAAKSGAGALQNPVQHDPAPSRMDSQLPPEVPAGCKVVLDDAEACETVQYEMMSRLGLEPEGTSPSNSSHSTDQADSSAAQSGAVPASTPPPDPELARLVEAWPNLPEHVKAAVLALVNTSTASREE